MVFVIIVVIAIIFVVLNVLTLDPWMERVMTGCGFFVCFTTLLGRYFMPKAYLLLHGADLDRNFKIVRAGAAEKLRQKKSYDKRIHSMTASAAERDREGESTALRRGGEPNKATTFVTKLPDTILDAEDALEYLRGHLMVLTQKATAESGDSSSNGSRESKKESRKSSGDTKRMTLGGGGHFRPVHMSVSVQAEMKEGPVSTV